MWLRPFQSAAKSWCYLNQIECQQRTNLCRCMKRVHDVNFPMNDSRSSFSLTLSLSCSRSVCLSFMPVRARVYYFNIVCTLNMQIQNPLKEFPMKKKQRKNKPQRKNDVQFVYVFFSFISFIHSFIHSLVRSFIHLFVWSVHVRSVWATVTVWALYINTHAHTNPGYGHVSSKAQWSIGRKQASNDKISRDIVINSTINF